MKTKEIQEKIGTAKIPCIRQIIRGISREMCKPEHFFNLIQPSDLTKF